LDDLVEFFLERESENFEFLERDGDDRVAGSWVLCILMLRTQRAVNYRWHQRQLTADTAGGHNVIYLCQCEVFYVKKAIFLQKIHVFMSV